METRVKWDGIAKKQEIRYSMLKKSRLLEEKKKLQKSETRQVLTMAPKFNTFAIVWRIFHPF